MEGKIKKEERKRSRDWVTGLGPDDVINSQRLNPLSHPQRWVSGCRSPRFEGEVFFFVIIVHYIYLSDLGTYKALGFGFYYQFPSV